MLGAEFASCFLVVAVITFTNVGGLAGGAGIVIFLTMAIYQFDTKNAIALQNACHIAGGLTRYVMSLRESHPLREGEGTLVDYNLLSLMMPGAILGASLGTIANLLLPGPLILAFFVASMSFTLLTGIRKYLSLKRTERTIVPLAHHQLPTQGSALKLAETPGKDFKDGESPLELEDFEGGQSAAASEDHTTERRLDHSDSTNMSLRRTLVIQSQPTMDPSQ